MILAVRGRAARNSTNSETVPLSCSPAPVKKTQGNPNQAVQRILATVDSIPRGCVATYGQVAEEAGLPRRARQVGSVLAALPKRTKLAWHRVLNAQGRVSERPGDDTAEQRQIRRLIREGVRPNESGRFDLQRYRWRPDD